MDYNPITNLAVLPNCYIRIDNIITEISPYLTNGDYYTAFEIFIKSSAEYMVDETELNYDHNYNWLRSINL